MNPDAQLKAAEFRYPTLKKWNVLEPNMPSEGLISVSDLAEKLNIKEDTLLKSLEEYQVHILKLSTDRIGWFVNLKSLSAAAYGNE